MDSACQIHPSPASASCHALEGPLRDLIHWPGGSTLTQLKRSRMWPGRHGRIPFELDLTLTRGGVDRHAPLQGVYGPPPARFESAVEPRFRGGVLSGVCLAIPEQNVWLCTPDCDPGLRRARKLFRPRSLRRALTETTLVRHLRDIPDHSSIELIAHRVGKRCMLRIRSTVSGRTHGAFLKCYRRMPTAETVALQRCTSRALEAATRGRVRAPDVLHASEPQRVIATREVPDAKPLGQTADDLEPAALVLAALHRLDLRPPNNHTPADEVHTVRRWLQLIQWAEPARAARLRRLMPALESRAQSLPTGQMALIHRDFYGAQLLRCDRSLWLLDYDTLCSGHPELDIATYVAHAVLDAAPAGSGQVDHAAQLFTRFVDAYASAGGPLDMQRLKFYVPCALARLGAINVVRPNGCTAVDLLWRVAETHLG